MIKSKNLEYYAGIDPGLSGAITLLDDQGNIITMHDAPIIVVKQGKKNRTKYIESSMVTIFESFRALAGGRPVHIGIENVHAMPKQGVTSMFSMGMGFGLWIGIIASARYPITYIESVAWKRGMGIAAKSDKSASIVRAMQLFPRAQLVKPRCRVESDGRAESLLIAEYLRRNRTTK